MCGIVGLISYAFRGMNAWQYKMFLNLLYSDALRGMHGTGLFAVDDEANTTRIKVGGPPNQLFGTEEFKETEKFLTHRDVKFLVGHNRYATKGQRITEHAHPFKDGHIILVHNGTLEKYRHLPDHEKFEVDSHLLTHAIAMDGVDKTIQSLEGAWTIVYWNAKDETMNFLRNSERPLFMAHHEKEKMFIFASEKEMLRWCLNRNGYYDFEVTEVPEDAHMSFPLNGKSNEEWKVRSLRGKELKKKGGYIELPFSAAAEACDTAGVTAAKEDEIKTPVRALLPSPASSTVSGDWGKGKTGRVRAGTGSSSSNPPKKNQWIAVQHLHTISKDDFLTVQVIDYDLYDNTDDLYKFTCSMVTYPDIEFIVNIRGEDAAIACADAPGGIKAQVIGIMKSMQPPTVAPHRIYMNNPQPVYPTLN